MRLSIVIISWQSLPMLSRCMEALRGVYGRDDVEIVWVDNGSTDGSEAYMAANFPKSRRIILDRNRGVAFARNRGIEAATGRYILLLDDDTEATPEAIDAMTEYLDTHEDTGLCAVALRDAEGRLQESFKRYPGVVSKVRNVLSRRAAEAELPAGVIWPEYVIGACQMFRRSLVEEIGMLDEKIFYGPEDADFCLRIKAGGHKVAYLPYACIMHHWRRITNRRLFSRISLLHMRGLLHLYIKHRRI